MALLKRIKNGTGDGAGRSRYALKKAVEYRTNIPSKIILNIPSLLTASLTSQEEKEFKKQLASEYNRLIKLWSGTYKTQHFVISFSHQLTEKEIQKALDKIEKLFHDPKRLYLIAVHREDHGTAFHIIESADPEGKLRHINRKQFIRLNLKIKKELQPFMNQKEKQTALNFKKRVATKDWKHQIEIKAPERSFKEHIRQTILKASLYLKQGDISKTVEVLRANRVELKYREKGQTSPKGRKLKHSHLYAICGNVAVRVDRKLTATYRTWMNAYQEVKDGLRRLRESTSGISDLEKQIRDLEERIRDLTENQGTEEKRITGTGTPDRGEETTIKNLAANFQKLGEQISDTFRQIEELKRRIRQHRETEDRETEKLRELRKELNHLEREILEFKERDTGHRELETQKTRISRKSERPPNREPETKEEAITFPMVNTNLIGTSPNKHSNQHLPADREKQTSGPIQEQRIHSSSSEKTTDITRPERTASLHLYSEQSSGVLPDRERTVESLEQPPKPLHTYYVGAIKSKTDSKAVISDNREVLKKLGAKNIKQINTPEEFAVYWEKEKCGGTMEIYGPVPEWMEEALKKAVWFKRVRAPYLISGEATRDIRPTGIRKKQYFKAEKGIILEDEVRNNPQNYFNSNNLNLKSFAESELEKREALEEKGRKRKKERENEFFRKRI